MLIQRVLAVAVLLPIGLAFIFLGGWPYAAFLILVLGVAAWEYWRIFHRDGYHPSAPIIIGAVVLVAVARAVDGFQWADLILAVGVLVSMGWHVFAYQKGDERAGTDFTIDLGGILYLGWVGSYLISLRNMPNGLWMLLLALPAVWIADSAAFFVGRKIGRHKMANRVSPGKSWEGYFAGVIFGALGTGLLSLAWAALSHLPLTFGRGMLLGLVLSALTPLGDLGESMLKRQFGVKDSSHMIPGHGGVMDRIDSWVWAGVISYYLINWFW